MKRYQSGGLTGQGIMNVLAGLESGTELNRIKSAEQAWRDYQMQRKLQTEKDLIARQRGQAIGGKGGGFMASMLGNALWGGDQPKYSPSLFGTGYFFCSSSVN